MTTLTLHRPSVTPSITPSSDSRLKASEPVRPVQGASAAAVIEQAQPQLLAIVLVGPASAEQDAIAQEIARQGFRVQRVDLSDKAASDDTQPINRVQNVLQRRLGSTAVSVISVGHATWAAAAPVEALLQYERLTIDRARHEVRVEGRLIPLSKTEFNLLHLLASRPEQVCTRQQIVTASRGNAFPVTSRSVDVHVAAVRRKLGVVGESVQTVRGVGYRFVPNATRVATSA